MQQGGTFLASAQVDLSDVLVVVVPGIGGSRLGTSPDDIVWDVRGPRIVDVLLAPEEVAAERPLEPFGLINTTRPFGVLGRIEGYDRLLSGLAGLDGAVVDLGRGGMKHRNLDANVIAAGYDFRWGVSRGADCLDQVLQPYLGHRWPTGGRGKVIFVAHSMGGLVVAEWLRRDQNRLWCRDFITLGTPFGGSMVALDVLARGVRVAGPLGAPVPPFRVRGRVLEVLRGWQAMYDLLPTGASVAVPAGTPLPTGMVDAHDLDLPWNARYAQAAKAMMADLDASREWQVNLRPFSGHGQMTLLDAKVVGDAVICSYGWPTGGGDGWLAACGDGTVSSARSYPVGYGVSGLNFAPSEYSKHGPLSHWPRPVEWVRQGAMFPTMHGDDALPAVLGLDVPDLAWAGEPISVQVRPPLRAEDVGEAAVTVASDDTRPVMRVPLTVDSETNSLVASLGRLLVGDYTIVAHWRHGTRELSTRAAVQVLDPDKFDTEQETNAP